MQQDVHQNGVTLYVYDSTSSIEIGTAGGAAGGTITIDSGSSVTESGTFYAPTIVDNGALTVAAGETLYMEGALGGSGSVTIDAGSTLDLVRRQRLGDRYDRLRRRRRDAGARR